jgi:hypothetical protein
LSIFNIFSIGQAGGFEGDTGRYLSLEICSRASFKAFLSRLGNESACSPIE